MKNLPPDALQTQMDLTVQSSGMHWRWQQKQDLNQGRLRRSLLLDPSPGILLSLTCRDTSLPSFSCLWRLHKGWDPQEAQINFSSTADFTAFLLLESGSNWIPAGSRVFASSGIEISQQQMMCCTWVFLRMELFAQNKAVISTVNYLQEAGPVSQHLLHLPVFILVGKNPTRAGIFNWKGSWF